MIFLEYVDVTVYTIYILCIYMVYTWTYMVYHVLMLHLAADVAEEDRVPFHWLHQQLIAWTNHNFHLSLFLRTLAILAPGEVDAQGAPGAVNSLERSCLTGKTLS